MADIVVDKEELKKRQNHFNSRVNMWLGKQKVESTKDLIKLTKGLVRKFGGDVIPAHEPSRKKLGFVWSRIVHGTEIAANPLVSCEDMSEQEMRKITKALLKANK